MKNTIKYIDIRTDAMEYEEIKHHAMNEACKAHNSELRFYDLTDNTDNIDRQLKNKKPSHEEIYNFWYDWTVEYLMNIEVDE